MSFILIGLYQGSRVQALYATWCTTGATKGRGGSRCYRPWDVSTCVAGTWLQFWRLPRHQGWIYRAPVKVGQILGVSLSLLACSPVVTIPATVPQYSEVPEGLTTYSAVPGIFKKFLYFYFASLFFLENYKNTSFFSHNYPPFKIFFPVSYQLFNASIIAGLWLRM
jgi:hypothetical protein